MNRRDALKGIAAVATLLTAGAAEANSPTKLMGVEPTPLIKASKDTPVLVWWDIVMEDTNAVMVHNGGIGRFQSKMIDQMNTLIDGARVRTERYDQGGVRMESDLVPYYSRETIVIFDHGTKDATHLSIRTDELFKRRGNLIDRALNLAVSQRASIIADESVTARFGPSANRKWTDEEMALFRSERRRVSPEIRARMRNVRVQMFMLPKT